MYPFGPVVAVSHRVPDCTRTGVAVREPISYQRAAFRRLPPVLAPTQEVLTAMFCAVHRLLAPVILLRSIVAMNTRSSVVSILVDEPDACCSTGNAVVGTVRFRLPEIEGVPPGFVTRRSTSRLNRPTSTPMKYPSVACGSS